MYIDATQKEEGVDEPAGDEGDSSDGRNDGAAARVK